MGLSKMSRHARIVVATLGLCYGGLPASAYAEDIAEFAAKLNAEYERPGVDWSRYERLIVNDLDVSGTKIIPPPWTKGKPFEWKVSKQNASALQKKFRESMYDQISGNDGYEIVSEAGDGVLEFTLEVVSFMPYAERKEEVITKGSGEMHISVTLRDAMNGQLLAIYEGPQEVGSEYSENTDFSRQVNLKMLFDSWGARVRIAMDRGSAQR